MYESLLTDYAADKAKRGRCCFVCKVRGVVANKEIKYFSFPVGKNRRHTLKKWLEFCRLPFMGDQSASTYWATLGFMSAPGWFLCSRHFKENPTYNRRNIGPDVVPEFVRPFGPDHCGHDGPTCCKLLVRPFGPDHYVPDESELQDEQEREITAQEEEIIAQEEEIIAEEQEIIAQEQEITAQEQEITATHVENFGNINRKHTGQECSAAETLTKLATLEKSEFFVVDNEETIVSTSAPENAEVSEASAEDCDVLVVSEPSNEVQDIPSNSELSSVQSHPSRIRVRRNLIHNLKDKLCRICGKNKEPLIPIQNEEELSVELTLTKKLEMYLPVEINTTKGFPLNICSNCHNLVESWHELYIACSAADSLFRELFPAEEHQDCLEVMEVDMRSQRESDIPQDNLQDISNIFDDSSFRLVKKSENEYYLATKTMQDFEEENVTPEKEVVNTPNKPTTFLPTNKMRMNIKRKRKRNSQNTRVQETSSELCTSHQVIKGKFRGKPVNFVMKPFTCEYCHTIFPTWEEYHPHTEKCKVEPTICEHCGVVIHQKVYLKKHMRTHLKIPKKILKKKGEKQFFICETCGKLLSSKHSLDNHRKVFHTSRSEKVVKDAINYCEPCCRVYSSSLKYKAHLKLHAKGTPKSCMNLNLVASADCDSEEVYKCPFCGKGFPDKFQVIKHLNAKDLLKCRKCKKVIENEKSALCHVCKWWVCQFCAREFSTKVACLNHENIHIGERRYMCHVCGKKFLASQALIRHRKSHELPIFKCDKCPLIFRNEVLFQIHLETHRENKKRPEYKCEQCNKPFGNKVLFRIHLERHDRQHYKCLHCDKKLMYQESLIKHCKKFHNDVVL